MITNQKNNSSLSFIYCFQHPKYWRHWSCDHFKKNQGIISDTEDIDDASSQNSVFENEWIIPEEKSNNETTISYSNHENWSIHPHAENTHYHEHTINDSESTNCDTAYDSILGKRISRAPKHLIYMIFQKIYLFWTIISQDI